MYRIPLLSAALIGLALLAGALAGVGLLTGRDAIAAPDCPTSWPEQDYEGFFTDDADAEWFIIRSADSNGYHTVRAYPANSRYPTGYAINSPDETCYLRVRRAGEATDLAEPQRLDFPKEPEPEPERAGADAVAAADPGGIAEPPVALRPAGRAALHAAPRRQPDAGGVEQRPGVPAASHRARLPDPVSPSGPAAAPSTAGRRQHRPVPPGHRGVRRLAGRRARQAGDRRAERLRLAIRAAEPRSQPTTEARTLQSAFPLGVSVRCRVFSKSPNVRSW